MTNRIIGTQGVSPVSSETSAAATTSTQASSPTKQTPEAPSATPEPVTIRWWAYDNGEDRKALMLNQAAAFEQTHPNVTILLTTIERNTFKQQIGTALNSAEPPSIFQNEGDYSLAAFAKAGLLQDISAETNAGWGAAFQGAALDRYAFDGRLYGAPQETGMVGIWYNKALFRRAGIENAPATWNEFLSDVGKLNAAGITPIAVGEGDKWSGAFWWEYLALRLGGRPAIDAALSRRGAFTDRPFAQAGVELKALIDLHPFEDGFLELNTYTYPGASQLFGDGKASMHLMGQWEKDNLQGMGEDVGWFPFPSVDGGEGKSGDVLGGPNGWLIGKDAPAETVEFLQAITSVDLQCQAAGLGVLPAVLAAGDCIQDPYLKTIWEALSRADYFQVYYDLFLPPATGQAVNDSVRGLFAGESSPAEVAEKIDSAYVAETS